MNGICIWELENPNCILYIADVNTKLLRIAVLDNMIYYINSRNIFKSYNTTTKETSSCHIYLNIYDFELQMCSSIFRKQKIAILFNTKEFQFLEITNNNEIANATGVFKSKNIENSFKLKKLYNQNRVLEDYCAFKINNELFFFIINQSINMSECGKEISSISTSSSSLYKNKINLGDKDKLLDFLIISNESETKENYCIAFFKKKISIYNVFIDNYSSIPMANFIGEINIPELLKIDNDKEFDYIVSFARYLFENGSFEICICIEKKFELLKYELMRNESYCALRSSNFDLKISKINNIMTDSRKTFIVSENRLYIYNMVNKTNKVTYINDDKFDKERKIKVFKLQDYTGISAIIDNFERYSYLNNTDLNYYSLVLIETKSKYGGDSEIEYNIFVYNNKDELVVKLILYLDSEKLRELTNPAFQFYETPYYCINNPLRNNSENDYDIMLVHQFDNEYQEKELSKLHLLSKNSYNRYYCKIFYVLIKTVEKSIFGIYYLDIISGKLCNIRIIEPEIFNVSHHENLRFTQNFTKINDLTRYKPESNDDVDMNRYSDSEQKLFLLNNDEMVVSINSTKIEAYDSNSNLPIFSLKKNNLCNLSYLLNNSQVIYAIKNQDMSISFCKADMLKKNEGDSIISKEFNYVYQINPINKKRIMIAYIECECNRKCDCGCEASKSLFYEVDIK